MTNRLPTFKRTERGWAGHYILSHRCLFRRNTLLEMEGSKIVVSTVGLLLNKDEVTREPIFTSRWYETRAFVAKEKDVFNDGDFSREIIIDSKHAIFKPDAEIEANQMHEDVVKELEHKMHAGKIEEIER